MRPITTLVVHCSDSPDSMDIGVHEISAWHRERGFETCGYHFVVRRGGRVEMGRPESRVGAHVKGHNEQSLGICWIGRDKPTETQRDALLKLLVVLARKYKVPVEKVVGHRELAPLSGKTCPNVDMAALREELALRLRPAS